MATRPMFFGVHIQRQVAGIIKADFRGQKPVLAQQKIGLIQPVLSPQQVRVAHGAGFAR